MFSTETLTEAESLCRALHSHFVDRLDDEERILFHVLERLQVATGMAGGLVRWGRMDTLDNIEKMLHSAIHRATEIISAEMQKGDMR